MTDIASWLLAIYDEQEKVARDAIDDRNRKIAAGGFRPGCEPEPDFDLPMVWDDWIGGPGIRWGAEGLLADIAAKRAIVEHCKRECIACDVEGQFCELNVVLRLLASAHADKPGYQQEWRV